MKTRLILDESTLNEAPRKKSDTTVAKKKNKAEVKKVVKKEKKDLKTFEQEVNQAEKELGGQAGSVIEGEAGDEYQGDIEQALNRALSTAMRGVRNNQRRGWKNVLLIGDSGTGKTERTKAWAKRHNINLVEVRCAGMDDTDLGGALVPDQQGEIAKRLGSVEFDDLETPGSVLFLDEYNRAPKSVRVNLLQLVNAHEIYDPRVKGKQRELKGFLFTVAAINPDDDGDFDTIPMDRAERTRFSALHVVPDKNSLLHHFNEKWTSLIENASNPEDKRIYEGQLKLAQALLSSKSFKLDDSEEAQEADDNGTIPLDARTFENTINSCDGTKEDLIREWVDSCNRLKLPMVQMILAKYEDIPEVDDKANSVFKDDVFAARKEKNSEKLRKIQF